MLDRQILGTKERPIRHRLFLPQEGNAVEFSPK